ncbi:hypothetical protein F5X68DRAFT_261106 [Plectosphaerella plurivora]|uniref:2EXR domain-containing protein n=1 Tax=Plectosphaerella plurivora TaxID=936078 RepID=A0A9P8VAU3_9PEZI|nr:hypothetical protein F5X68DRAFT_261106 [Plectosphaerella plurivora]
MAATTFHRFPLLPLELRHLIWDHCIEPRRVEVPQEDYHHEPPPVPARAPVLLHVCSESRSWVKRYYTKAIFIKKEPYHFYWINYDIDMIHVSDEILYSLSKRRSIKHLSITVKDPDRFRGSHWPRLESLQIWPCDAGGKTWLHQWDFKMEMYYYTDDNTAPFRMTVVNPSHNPVPELNPDNYLKTMKPTDATQAGDMNQGVPVHPTSAGQTE